MTMSLSNVMVLVLYSLAMSLGQVLFKMAADRAKARATSGFLESLLTDGYFFLSVAIYGVLTVLWIWLLTRVPLSRAYPFVVLAFVFTPGFAVLFFDESLNIWYFLGLGLILSGLALLVLKAH
jgi:drug/metabolite transporter (DMT)-like permease